VKFAVALDFATARQMPSDLAEHHLPLFEQCQVACQPHVLWLPRGPLDPRLQSELIGNRVRPTDEPTAGRLALAAIAHVGTLGAPEAGGEQGKPLAAMGEVQ